MAERRGVRLRRSMTCTTEGATTRQRTTQRPAVCRLSAVCRLPSAVCRLPSAVCRPISKLSTRNAIEVHHLPRHRRALRAQEKRDDVCDVVERRQALDEELVDEFVDLLLGD